MNIYYDNRTARLYQRNLETIVTMGGEKQSIPYQNPGLTQTASFHLHIKNNHTGPLIGIMTARRSDGTITGNSHLFIKLQLKMVSLGGLSFIFTPESVYHDYIYGYIYVPESSSWNKIKIPYPDLVYNRIPFRKLELKKNYQSIFTVLKEKKIPFFNPCFLDKYELYCHFQKHPVLQNFVPETELIYQKEKLESFLTKHHLVYLKPVQSAKGKGIFRLSLLRSMQIHLEGINFIQIYPSFQAFWEEWKAVFLEQKYIVQEDIRSALFEGKRFDFRILAHAENENYIVTGVGIRQALEQEVTTHIPNGGKLLPYQLLQTKEHDQFINLAVQETGKTLTEKFGFFGEFSIDAGISFTGKYYIFEVNSKPMSFDETEIEERRVAELCRLFFQLTDYK